MAIAPVYPQPLASAYYTRPRSRTWTTPQYQRTDDCSEFRSTKPAMGSYHKRPSSPTYKIVNPARSSTNSISSSSYDPYYGSSHHRSSRDDYGVKSSSKPGSGAYTGGVIPISTETYVIKPSTSSRAHGTDSYSGRSGRSAQTDADTKGQSALRSRSSAVAHGNHSVRPSSPLSRNYDPEDIYARPPTTTKREHKRVYSVDDRTGASKLVDESESRSKYVDDERDRARRERRAHHRPKEVDEASYSYTDPAGMYRDTEPSWRPRERRRSVDRGSSGRAVNTLDPYATAYGPPPRASTTRFDGPSSSTRGLDKVSSSSISRSDSVRQPVRASSRERYRSNTYDPYLSDEGHNRRTQQRDPPRAQLDLPYRSDDRRRSAAVDRGYYDEEQYRGGRQTEGDSPRRKDFRDEAVETRGFGIRRRSPSKERYGTSSNESLDHRRHSYIPHIPAGYVASPTTSEAPEYSQALTMPSGPMDYERHRSRDDRDYPSSRAPPEGKDGRKAVRDDRGYGRDPPFSPDERRSIPDQRQYMGSTRDEEDRRPSRNDRSNLAPPPPRDDERRPSPSRHDRERDRGYDRDSERSSQRDTDHDDHHQHHYSGLGAAAAATTAAAAGAAALSKHRRDERENDSERGDGREDTRRDERRDTLRGVVSDRDSQLRPKEQRDRDRRNTEVDPRTRPEAEEQDPKPTESLDPDEDYRRRVQAAQRELAQQTGHEDHHSDFAADREARRLRREGRHLGRESAGTGVAGVADHELAKSQDGVNNHDLPPPPPGGPPSKESSDRSYDDYPPPPPRDDPGRFSYRQENGNFTDRGLTAEPADIHSDDMSLVHGDYPRDPQTGRPEVPAMSITDATALVPVNRHRNRRSRDYDENSRTSSASPERRETRVRIVEPARDQAESPPQPVKSILRKPTEKFPEHPNPIREGVAPLKDARVAQVMKERGIPAGAKWTKIDRKLVNPQALEEAKERFEERLDCVIVLRVLTKEEIQSLADRTRDIRDRREERYEKDNRRHRHDNPDPASSSSSHRRRKNRSNRDGDDRDVADDDDESDDSHASPDSVERSDRSRRRDDDRRDGDREKERERDDRRREGGGERDDRRREGGGERDDRRRDG